MNNCPKCGNPLQPGTTSCPICGTNIESLNNSQPQNQAVQNNITVSSVSNPVGSPAQNNIEPTPTPVAPIVTPVDQNQQTNNALEEVTATQNTSPAVSPVPMPTPSSVEATAVPNNVNNSESSNEGTLQNQANVQPATLSMPAVEQIVPSTPVPSIPSSLNQSTPVAETTTPNVKTPEVVPPKKNNKKTIMAIIIILLIVGVCGGAFYVLNYTSLLGTNNTNNNSNNEQTTATSSTYVNSNGYKFNLSDGWTTSENGDKVIIVNSEETVALSLSHSASSLDSIDDEKIKAYLSTDTAYTNTTINKTTISAKDAYLVDTYYNNMPVQVYFINGGSNLTLGVMIAYQSEDSKTKYESATTELVGSISYSDDSIKALDTFNMYSSIFGIYNGVINYEESTTDQDQTSGQEENAEQNQTGEENTSDQEQSENGTEAEPTTEQ